MTRSGTFKLIRLLVSVGLIAYMIFRLDPEEVGAHLRGLTLLPLCLAALADFGVIGVNSLRWRVLLAARGIHPSQAQLLYYYLVGNFFSAFLPTAVGGDVVRVVGLSAGTARRADVFASVLVERLLGFFVLLPLGLCAIPFIGREQVDWGVIGTVWTIAGLFFMTAFVLMLRPVARQLLKVIDPLLRPLGRFRAFERIERAYEAVLSYRCCWPALVQGFMISAVSRLLWITGCYLVARAFSIDIGFPALLLVVPIVELARMIPISISGIGVREATFVALLGRFGVDDTLAFTYSVIVYLVFMLFALIGGLLYAGRQVRPQDPRCES
jgi:uncharacterized protein (TIRG00374 family)